MKVNVVCHDLSNNCLGRAWSLARLLARSHDVDIVGRIRGDGLWAPLRPQEGLDAGIPIRAFPPGGPRAAVDALDGDLVYAVKPKAGSLGVGLLARRRTIPLIVDIDDWETAFYLENPRWMLRSTLAVWESNNLWTTWGLERLAGRADAITVSTTFLQRRFGGTIIPHARSAELFSPDVPVDADLLDRIGLAGKTVVLFLGSVRPHKGVGDVIAALDLLADPDLGFLVVGPDEPLPERPYLRMLGPQPFSTLPRLVGLADLVVLAQRRNRIGDAQLPAKVFDAMAMAKPVVATRVSDLPEVLDGCGVIVEPGDVAGLARAIARLAADAQERARLGSLARQRFLDRFSDDVVAPQLEAVVDRAMAPAGR